MSDRIVVGVTGHRTLPPGDALVAAVDAALDRIERLTAGREAGARALLTALSPLAEGADRLVAERVLARPGGELEVVLPLGEDDYRADFPTNASRRGFGRLLSQARRIRRLPPFASRPAAYAAAGREVVDRCDVLVAIWDGRPEDGPGGTAEIVRYAKEKGRPLVRIDPDRGEVQIDGDLGTHI